MVGGCWFVASHLLAHCASVETMLFVVWYCYPALFCGVYHMWHTVQYGQALITLAEHCTFPLLAGWCFQAAGALLFSLHYWKQQHCFIIHPDTKGKMVGCCLAHLFCYFFFSRGTHQSPNPFLIEIPNVKKACATWLWLPTSRSYSD